MSLQIQPGGTARGEITVPGDKSISHRSVMFGSLAEGETRIRNFLRGADCLSTISCFRQMGAEIIESGDEVIVKGRGLHAFRQPSGTLCAGNSGTTVRLMSGILAGLPFETRITGDASIQARPMKRIIDPLRKMGAQIRSEKENGCAPLVISPSALHGISYQSPVASAQVKSCILLAGLYAEGETTVTEPALSRDHTERMLRAFGADLTASSAGCTLKPGKTLTGLDIAIPGDISAAAYFIAAALLLPGSELLIKNVGINPTRDGMLRVCMHMGADIEILNRRVCGGEEAADLLVRHSSLHGTDIGGDIIPALIDELPILAVLAAFAEGTTRIRDAAELRVKESDRILSVTGNLSAIGADVQPLDDGMIIKGGKNLHGAQINSCRDHRIAMSFAVAAKACTGPLCISDPECVNISFPGFFAMLDRICTA